MEHIPVLLNEIIEYLQIDKDGTYVDATLGGGGHAEAVLKNLDNGRLIAFDQDSYAIEKAKERLSCFEDKLIVINRNFKHMKMELAKREITNIDGIYFDLGVSSFHFDDKNRGFSYREEAPLDMRMDQSASLTARQVLNTYEESELRRILFEYGEERHARRIAAEIVKSRQNEPIVTTFDLVDIVKKALPAKVLSKKGHPAKRTFQAIRIEVNDELDILKQTFEDALNLLKPGGRLLVISFHSLEDKIVKDVFKAKSTIDFPKDIPIMPEEEAPFILASRKVVKPTAEEVAMNHRSHSAKLRVIEKK